MADNNKLELVVEVDVNNANVSIRRVNTGLSSMDQAAAKAARGASAGMVKGATVGNLLAPAMKAANREIGVPTRYRFAPAASIIRKKDCASVEVPARSKLGAPQAPCT